MDDASSLLDKPIQSDSEDKLERSKIVNAIKSRIDNHKSTESITIGIEGSWGAGKTSIINLLLNKFDENWRDMDRHDIVHSVGNWIVNKIKLYWSCISIHMNFYSDVSNELMITNSLFAPRRGHGNKKHDYSNTPLIIFFNPWNYSNNGQILNDFFRAINNAIEKEDMLITSEFRKNASRYVPNIMDSKTLGIGGSLSIWPFGVSARFSKTIAQKPVYESKGLLDRTLQRLDKKIIVIIDDIDRLDVDETLLIFKLTKIVADFPNMVFILAYDKDKTIQKINTKFEGNPILGTTSFEGNFIDGNKKLKGNLIPGIMHSYDGVGDNFIDKIVQYDFHIPKTHRFNYEKYFAELIEVINVYSNLEISDIDTWNTAYKYYLYTLLQTPRNAKQYIKNIITRLSIIDAKEICLQDFLLIEAVRIYAIDVYNSIYDNKLALVYYVSPPAEPRTHGKKQYNSLLQEICGKSPVKNKKIIMDILLYLFPYEENLYEYSLRICTKYDFDKYFTMSLDPRYISEKEIEELKNKLNKGINVSVEYSKKIFGNIAYENRYSVCRRILTHIESYNHVQLTNLLPSLWELSENGVWPLHGQDIWYFERRILEKLNYVSREKSLLSAIQNVNIKYIHLYFLIILNKRQKENKQKELFREVDIDKLRSMRIEELESKYKMDIKKFAISFIKSKDNLIKLLCCYPNITTKSISINRAALSKYFDDIAVVDHAVTQLNKNVLNERDTEIIDWYENALNSSMEEGNDKVYI